MLFICKFYFTKREKLLLISIRKPHAFNLIVVWCMYWWVAEVRGKSYQLNFSEKKGWILGSIIKKEGKFVATSISYITKISLQVQVRMYQCLIDFLQWRSVNVTFIGWEEYSIACNFLDIVSFDFRSIFQSRKISSQTLSRVSLFGLVEAWNIEKLTQWSGSDISLLTIYAYYVRDATSAATSAIQAQGMTGDQDQFFCKTYLKLSWD